jgi:hypothetical protein
LSLLAGWEGGEEFGIKNATLDDFKIILLFVQHKTFVYYRMHQHTYRYRTYGR